ncbi:MAG: glucosyl-3-phosphoglycerate synthase [Chloroflexi bacterium]|nr:glucosyl-3-phosphoglycerate synthase [Chloroflexota bacterium]
MNSAPEIRRVITAVGDVERGIKREAAGHRAIVLGSSFAGPSPLVQHLIQQSNTAVVVVRAKQQEPITFHAPRRGLFGRRRASQPPEKPQEELSIQVDRWFAENTFHSNEFADLQALLTLKEKQGATISIGLPALNEEETVGKVICTLKKALMEDLPLVDEIVVIDSLSTDKTVEIAESLGVPVYKHPEILPEVGSYRGKGEALWKSLYVLKGDIVAWIDTDITNIHPRFIYGILGPLLKRPDVQYVKGFYQRPIKVGDQLQAYGGGRVTELVARPWLNLFYPELSGIVQPLSGEYAGRRSALEKMPFFSGYGVETGLLLDLLNTYGLDGIAQTDLEERVHHNQPLVGLSKMSFAILQVFIMRLEKRYGVQLLDKANRTMKMVAYGPERFALDVAEIGDVERPPINTLPTYREKFGI